MENQTPIVTPPSVPPSEPVSSTPEKSTNSRAWEKWVIILLLIAALSCGIIVYLLTSQPNSKASPAPKVNQSVSPTPDPTANWKTYTNKKYGYQLKYPINLQPDEANGDPADNDVKQMVRLSYCTISVRSNGGYKTLNEWAKNYKVLAVSGSNLVKTTEDATLGGLPAKKFSIFQFDHDDTAIATMYKNNISYFSYSNTLNNENYSKEDQQSEAVCKQILSTFKFIDQTPPPTCRPRPACLDSQPRCMIPETEDMCPKAIATPAIKEKCPCWDANKNTCLPQSACQ